MKKLLILLLFLVLLTPALAQEGASIKEISEFGDLINLSNENPAKFIFMTKDCPDQVLSNPKIIQTISTDEYNFIIIETTLSKAISLSTNHCVIYYGDEFMIDNFLLTIQDQLERDFEELAKDLQLFDASPPLELNAYFVEDKWRVQPGQEHSVQQFVTPELNSLANGNKEEIYNVASTWIWISDQQLHGQIEKWLTPEQFLLDTPEMLTNPTKNIASDCSEQANTLVSMLRKSGVSPEEVRVVLGKVNFGGRVGGHAWVEILEDGKWLALEPTSGPSYTTSLNQRIALPYNYFKWHQYPVEEVWMYYNDVYFTDERAEVAEFWSEGVAPSLEDEILRAIQPTFFEKFIAFFKNLF